MKLHKLWIMGTKEKSLDIGVSRLRGKNIALVKRTIIAETIIANGGKKSNECRLPNRKTGRDNIRNA